MTEPVNLEILEAHLASMILPDTGNAVPMPLLILPDTTPLYDEEPVLIELETALADNRPANFSFTITNVEVYSSSLVTLSFEAEGIDKTFKVNIPRQYAQVGRIFHSMLGVPAVSIATPTEMDGYEKNNGLEPYSEILAEDLFLNLMFPTEASEEFNTAVNTVLNYTDPELLQASLEDNNTGKVALYVSTDELSDIRGEFVDIIISLINGSEEALISLYEYAEIISQAMNSVEKKTPLTKEEKTALVFLECVNNVYLHTQPTELITQILDEAEIDDINDFQRVLQETGALEGLTHKLSRIYKNYQNKNPDALTIDEESTHEERIDYLSKATNLIPLLGGLFELSDRINIDLLYSRDWNEVEEVNDLNRGEYTIILSLLIAQRIQMLAKVLGDTEQEDVNMLAMALLLDDLTADHENELWIMTQGLKRLSLPQPLIFTEFLQLTVDVNDGEANFTGPLGALYHRFGHAVVQEGWGEESMLIAFEKQPIIQHFIVSLFNEYNEVKDVPESEQEGCYSAPAVASLMEEEQDTTALIKELGEALTILAELNVMKTDFKKDSDEWKISMKQYLKDIAETSI